MIRLTINSRAISQTVVFDKQVVIIGSVHSEKADLSLPGEDIQEEHIKITEQNGAFFIQNIANDPFVTLNELPFGKRPLKNRDVIQIGNTFIFFEGELPIPEQLPVTYSEEMHPTEDKLVKIVQKAISEKISKKDLRDTQAEEKSWNLIDSNNALWKIPEETYPDFNLEEEIERLEAYARRKEESLPQEEDTLDIEALVREAEELEMPPIEVSSEKLESEDLSKKEFEGIDPSPFQINIPSISSSQAGISLKDRDLSEFDEENENGTADAKDFHQASQPANNLRLLWVVLLIVIITLSIGGGLLYFTLSGKSEQEEIRAAKRIADVAMALTYAQVHHINPPKHNWSDPGFLKNNLAAVLTPNYPSISNIDFNGHFSDCPYILRVYTSNDLSQFLVIAQPEPTLWHWLVPKASVIVDSRTMELHKINDLKVLNRLLVNSSNLDGDNAVEISSLIKGGELILLSTLNTDGESEGFNASRALALIRPGAEHRIYNAPRYYHLGDSILKRAVAQAETAQGNHELQVTQQMMEPLTKFPDLVLYSSLGMQKAMQAQKALTIFVPREKFLIAFLVFNLRGEISSSHLLIDHDSSYAALQPASNTPRQSSEEIVKTLVTALDLIQEKIREQKEQNDSKAVNEQHPLYLELAALATKRQESLKPITEVLMTLISNNSKAYSSNFQKRFKVLSSEYDKQNSQHKTKVQEEITRLSQEYAHISFSQFLTFAKAVGLKEVAEEHKAVLASILKNDWITDATSPSEPS